MKKYFGVLAGEIGVMVFFLISGYVIAQSLEKYSFKEFVINRFWRIIPTNIISLVLILFSAFILGFNVIDLVTIKDYIANAFLVQPFLGIRPVNPVIWSLVVEVIFYLYAAIWFTKITKMSSRGVLVASIFLVVIEIICIILDQVTFLETKHTIKNLLATIVYNAYFISCIMVGMGFYVVKKEEKSNYLIILLIMSVIVGFEIVGKYMPKLIVTPPNTCIVAIGIFYFTVQSNLLNSNNKILTFFADISYPLYLNHCILGWIILSYVQNITQKGVLVFIVGVGSVVLISYLVHYLVEKPSMKLAKKMTVAPIISSLGQQ